MKKSNRLTVLPNRLLEDVYDIGLSKVQQDKAIQLIDILKQKSLNKFGGGYIFGESTLSQSYFREVFNSRYAEFLKPLVEQGIIIQGDSYNVNAGIAKSYAINNKYENSQNISSSCLYISTILSSNLISNNNSLEYAGCNHSTENNLLESGDIKGYRETQKMEFSAINYNVKVSDKVHKKDNFFLRKFKSDFKTLRVDVDRLTKITVDKLSKLSIGDFNVNEGILTPAVKLKFGDRWAYLKTPEAIDLAKKDNKILVQDKGNFHIEEEKSFMTRKVNNIYSSYMEVIKKLDKKYYYASINYTNNRLDTNITSMCSEFMKVIKDDNDLVELDMANSQFAILSHIMPDLDTIDYRLFKALSFSGDLYAHIKCKLELETLKEAKNITFQVLFGKGRQRTQGFKDFTELFPSVMEWINQYKKEHGHKEFPIMLQKEESKIFIDNLYTEIKRKKLFCLTKHDSLIIRKEDLKEIQEYVQEYFDSIGFEGTLKVN